MPNRIIGWDIGGAHLKAARVTAAGVVEAVIQVPCALWRGLDELSQALEIATQHVGESERHAVTMTGEMVDLFPDRKTGVVEIARFFVAQFHKKKVNFYCGDRHFVDVDAASFHALAIASANWRASVEFVSSKIPQCVFVDVGSTTTDIIANENSRPRFRGQDDYTRLVCGELVYSGVVRTPVMALGESVKFCGGQAPVVAEHFATMADVYRVLDELPDNVDQHPTADGAQKTPFASARRLARMIGRDVDSGELSDWRALALSFRAAQMAKIASGLAKVSPHISPIVGAGIGEFLIRKIARETGRDYIAFAALMEIAGPTANAVTHVAPAVAVALLAQD